MSRFIVGVSGGIGSGKSTVADALARLGAAVGTLAGRGPPRQKPGRMAPLLEGHLDAQAEADRLIESGGERDRRPVLDLAGHPHHAGHGTGDPLRLRRGVADVHVRMRIDEHRPVAHRRHLDGLLQFAGIPAQGQIDLRLTVHSHIGWQQHATTRHPAGHRRQLGGFGFAVVNGIGNIEPLMNEIKKGRTDIHYIEVMACEGGCVGGGGQPIHPDNDNVRARAKSIYELDEKESIRVAHQNASLQKVYESFLLKPGSEISHTHLYTTYQEREVMK